MIGVKITVLLIVLTVIWKFVAEILIKGESMERKIQSLSSAQCGILGFLSNEGMTTSSGNIRLMEPSG